MDIRTGRRQAGKEKDVIRSAVDLHDDGAIDDPQLHSRHGRADAVEAPLIGCMDRVRRDHRTGEDRVGRRGGAREVPARDRREERRRGRRDREGRRRPRLPAEDSLPRAGGLALHAHPAAGAPGPGARRPRGAPRRVSASAPGSAGRRGRGRAPAVHAPPSRCGSRRTARPAASYDRARYGLAGTRPRSGTGG